MGEILNGKTAGVYFNNELVGEITDISVKVGNEIIEHQVVGDDRKLFDAGVLNASFNFTALHTDDNKINYLSGSYPLYDTATDKVVPASLNNLSSHFSIWQTSENNNGLTIYNDSAPDENYQAAQSFISPGTSLSSLKLKLGLTGSPTFNSDLDVEIYADTADEPSGAALITAIVPEATLDGLSADTWVTCTTIVNTTALVQGTKYWIVCSFADDATENGDSSAHLIWLRSDTNYYKPAVYDKTSSSEQIADENLTHCAVSIDSGANWTPNASDLDACFVAVFLCSTQWNIAIRLVGADGVTVVYFVLKECVFDAEDKSIAANDSLRSTYSGKARSGKYSATYDLT